MEQVKSDIALYQQVRNLPLQLDRARRRVAALENQAARFGLHDLLAKPHQGSGR